MSCLAGEHEPEKEEPQTAGLSGGDGKTLKKPRRVRVRIYGIVQGASSHKGWDVKWDVVGSCKLSKYPPDADNVSKDVSSQILAVAGSLAGQPVSPPAGTAPSAPSGTSRTIVGGAGGATATPAGTTMMAVAQAQPGAPSDDIVDDVERTNAHLMSPAILLALVDKEVNFPLPPVARLGRAVLPQRRDTRARSTPWYRNGDARARRSRNGRSSSTATGPRSCALSVTCHSVARQWPAANDRLVPAGNSTSRTVFPPKTRGSRKPTSKTTGGQMLRTLSSGRRRGCLMLLCDSDSEVRRWCASLRGALRVCLDVRRGDV